MYVCYVYFNKDQSINHYFVCCVYCLFCYANDIYRTITRLGLCLAARPDAGPDERDGAQSGTADDACRLTGIRLVHLRLNVHAQLLQRLLHSDICTTRQMSMSYTTNLYCAKSPLSISLILNYLSLFIIHTLRPESRIANDMQLK